MKDGIFELKIEWTPALKIVIKIYFILKLGRTWLKRYLLSTKQALHVILGTKVIGNNTVFSKTNGLFQEIEIKYFVKWENH